MLLDHVDVVSESVQNRCRDEGGCDATSKLLENGQSIAIFNENVSSLPSSMTPRTGPSHPCEQ